MRAPPADQTPRGITRQRARGRRPRATSRFPARLGHVPHPSRPGPTPGRLRMSPTCPRSEVLCDIARCAADRLLSVGGGGDAGPARPRQPFCGRCGRPGTSGSPAGPGWLPTRAGSTPATTRSCAVLRTSSCSTPTTPTNDADTAAGLTVDVTPAATSRCKPDAPRTGRRRRAEHRAAGRHHPHPRDLPERNKLVVLVGSTKDIGQAVRVPAPAGATRPWTTASRQRSTAEGAQPSDHCTSRRFRPTGQAKLNCRCRRTEFISGSTNGTAGLSCC